MYSLYYNLAVLIITSIVQLCCTGSSVAVLPRYEYTEYGPADRWDVDMAPTAMSYNQFTTVLSNLEYCMI